MKSQEIITPFPSFSEALLRERHQNGAMIEYLTTEDEYADHPERLVIQEEMLRFEQELRDHPEITIDSEDNHARNFLFGSSETMRSWATLMPNATALYPLQRPDETHLPNGVEIDDMARLVFRHSTDAIGIRSRAEVMKQKVQEHFTERRDTPKRWVSLACGAAVPVLDTLKDVDQSYEPHLTLVDYDREALSFATELATAQGLSSEQYSIEETNLIKEMVLTDRYVQRHGEKSFDMVDMLGIFEYFDHKRASKMLANAHRLLSGDGLLIIGNMLDTHPTLEINRRAVGWPTIKPRSIEEILQIVSDAGIDAENTTVSIPEDGVYAVVSIKKAERPAGEPLFMGRSALRN